MSDLPREARLILAKLQLCMHGSITAYNSSGGRDSEHPGGKRPVGDGFPPHVRWRAVMLAKPWLMEQHVRGAEHEWRQITGISVEPKVKRSTPDVDERMLVLSEGAGHPAKYVALRFRWSESQVRRARIAEGLDSETGREPKVIRAPDKMPAALRMREQGCSYRQIEMMTGIAKSTVLDAVRRAA